MGQSFVLFTAADSTKSTEEGVNPVVVDLVKQGLAYFCAWGPGCSELETHVDLAIVKNGLGPSDDDVIMTTSHDGEPLKEALWFFAHCAFPAYECEDWIAVAVGNDVWAKEIRRLIPEVLKPLPED
jgi:hypothetical protein